MSKISRFALITAVVAAAALTGAAISYFTMGLFSGGERTPTWIDEEASADVRGLGDIRAEAGSADIRVRPAAGEELGVSLHGSAGGERPELLPRLVVERRDDILEIRISRPRKVHLSVVELMGHLTLELEIPHGYGRALSLSAGSGDIDAADLTLGELSLTTGSGDMNLDSVTVSGLDTGSGSGDLTARELSAESARFEAASGEIRITSYRGGAEVVTGSGDVRLRLEELGGDLDIGTASGDVRLEVPEAANFRFQARSTSGDITSRIRLMPAEVPAGEGRHVLAGRLGSGRHLITVSTASGDITLAH